MQMYVNYYDRFEKREDENPAMEVLPCREKNDALVEIALPEDSNIYASEYKLYLPDKKLLQQKHKEGAPQLKPIYSKNQIISIIAYVFRERYSLEDLRHIKQSWTDNEELYKRRILAHFVYDIIIVEWDQGGSKLHYAITSGKYMEPISPTA